MGLARDGVRPSGLEPLNLEPLNSHSTRRPSRPRLPFQPWPAFIAAIGAIHHTALGLPAFTRLACRTGQTARSAIHPDLDLLSREALRQLYPHRRTRRAWQAIAAVVAIGAAPGRTPGATRVHTIGAVQTGIPLGTGAPTGIHRQFVGSQRIDTQDQIPPGFGWPLMGAGRAARGGR